MAHEDPRGDRDWEHWPGRKPDDEGIRHRLRALFSSTDGDDALEARIEEKGREIEEHADQLQTTISDLERREARTGQLRTAVEEMLRQGSAELDERHAALTQLSTELAAREEAVRAGERDIAVRKQELGAVELRRAAVERREEVVSAREAELERITSALGEREHALTADRDGGSIVAFPPSPDAAAGFEGTMLVLTDPGYRMADRPDPPPSLGETVDIDGAGYRVVRTGRSPLPGDRRCWVYLEPLETNSGA